MSDIRKALEDDDPVVRRIARMLDAKRRDNEEALGALKAADRSWDRLNKEVDQEIGKEFDLLGAEERAVKAARDRLDGGEVVGVPPVVRGREVGTAAQPPSTPPPSLKDSLDESLRSVEERGKSMRAAHTAVTRFAKLTRDDLESLRGELATDPPDVVAAIPVAGIELPEPSGGGGGPTPAIPRPTTSTPLENIRGIGPVRADRLRAAGIPDLEAFLRTDTAKLVELAGFDADVAKEEARKVLEEVLASRGERTRGGS